MKQGRRPPRPTPAIPPTRGFAPAHVTSARRLAAATEAIAEEVERAVAEKQARADRAIAQGLRAHPELSLPDRRFVSEAIFALFRWKGWIETMPARSTADRLLAAWVLDAPTLHPVALEWAKAVGRDTSKLVALGKAPGWTPRAEGLKRAFNLPTFSADPWRLFPEWIRPLLPVPPGEGSAKVRLLGAIHAFQQRPALWIRVQQAKPEAVWSALREANVQFRQHARHTAAATVPTDTDLPHLECYAQGLVEIQDLAAQAVGRICDPKPGDRWWDACAGAGGKSLQLATLMKNRGSILATDPSEIRLKELVKRYRRGKFSNISAKPWDGKKLPSKPGTFDGVLVDAPCSGMGTWKRNPDARWSLHPARIDEFARTQLDLLKRASAGVKPGGKLVYAVCSVLEPETKAVVDAFLREHPEFRLDPCPTPLGEQTCDGTYTVWPHEHDSDAMFIARMIRSGAAPGSAPGQGQAQAEARTGKT